MNNSTILLFTTTLFASAPNVYAANSSDKPNIIFILTDDQPYSLLGYTGHALVQTPNIDKLAERGQFFTNAHISSPISSPSRTCILTGRYERNHGVNFNSGTALSQEAWMECYPMLLKKGGYYTGYVGKNHTPVGTKGYKSGIMDNSFDYWYGGHNHLKFYPKTAHEIFKWAKNETQIEVVEEGVLDFLTPEKRNLKGAIHFLDNRPSGQPFFLNICFNLPHCTGTSTMKMKDSDPEIYRTMYRDKDIPLPEFYIAKKDIVTPKLPSSVLHIEDRQSPYDYVETPETLREMAIREMEVMTGIDNLIGRLMSELKNQKLDKNTIIIFTSDHGIFNGEYGMGGKSLCYELCTKVPMIIYDPRTPKSENREDNDELVLSIDLAPTILNYAGINVPESYQGENLIPMLKGEQEQVREYLYTENLWSTHFGNPRCESIQDKEWKYIRYYKNDNTSAEAKMQHLKELGLPASVIYKNNLTDVLTYRIYVDARINGEQPVYEELYNLKNDPKESTNLIGDSKHNQLVEKLRKECDIALKNARGEGDPRVEVITPDYLVEFGDNN